MKLNQYIKLNRMTYRTFHEYCEQNHFHFSMGTLNKWISGQRIPKGENLKRIHTLTNGEVTVFDFENDRESRQSA
mgnify:FL=1